MVGKRLIRQIPYIPILLWSLCSLTQAQTSPNTQATPTFRANSRLVQVDVIVLDGSGRPIRGLTDRDFTILEDGKPQQLRSFDRHETSEASPVVLS